MSNEVDEGWKKGEMFRDVGRLLGLSIRGRGGALPALMENAVNYVSEYST